MTGPEDETPEKSADDKDVGWGDDAAEDAGTYTDDWYLAERPPHHGT